ncbi:hypothetical protein F4824DRAFT_501898 [Ustulina deusta]|nr:hypothetical protein F4824DRAFT_501898 [Ustulina deusta]
MSIEDAATFASQPILADEISNNLPDMMGNMIASSNTNMSPMDMSQMAAADPSMTMFPPLSMPTTFSAVDSLPTDFNMVRGPEVQDAPWEGIGAGSRRRPFHQTGIWEQRSLTIRR